MSEWRDNLVKNHGERFVFIGGATTFAVACICLGIFIEELKSLLDAGVTVIIGIMMLLYNKSRSGQPINGQKPPTNEPTE